MTMPTTKEILDFDPLAAIEDLTGRSYKDDDSVAFAGLGLAMIHNRAKEAHLKALGDSTHGHNIDDYLAIIADLGFEQVLALPFEGRSLFDSEEPAKAETFYIYAHPVKGILLSFDTYCGERVNGGKFHYCWLPNPGVKTWNVTSSGGMRSLSGAQWTEEHGAPTDMYWAGDHDCREAIRYHIAQLEANGTFYMQWPKGHNKFLWLLHYMDTKEPNYDHKAITAARIAMLPDWVQAMINVD